MARLVITVKEIKGHCAVHNVGDKIIIEGPQIDTRGTKMLCIHALPSILHFAVPLREGVDPVELGLAKEGKKAYIHCPDPGQPYTDGGEVVFEVERIED